MNRRKDLIWGISLLITSIIITIYSYTIPAPGFVKGLARVNPYIRIWSFVLALLSVCLIVSTIVNTKNNKNGGSHEKNLFITFPAVFTIGMLVLYLILMPILGYIISTILFLFIIMLYYKKINQKDIELNYKNLTIEILKYLTLSITITLITHQIFVRILNIVVPSGKIFIK